MCDGFMDYSAEAVFLDYIPENAKINAIQALKASHSTFSLEYSIFSPDAIYVTITCNTKGILKKNRDTHGFASIKQFLTDLGLHPDFQSLGNYPISIVLNILQNKFALDPEREQFFTGGLIGRSHDIKLPLSTTINFSEALLEILTDSPHFAFIQFIFRSKKKIPKEFLPEEPRITQIKFNIQEGRIDRHYNTTIEDIMNELGCFEFSPRIILVETDSEILRSKIERITVIFSSYGLSSKVYPSFWNRISSFMNICRKRKLVLPIVVDGFSLMSYISPPQRQFTKNGYSLIPHKSRYQLSTRVFSQNMRQSINIGIPIFSGKTSDEQLTINGKDLCRHIAVFGMTGEGKSRFIFGLIREFYTQSSKFLIFDPKGEYLFPISTFCKDFSFLKPGSTSFPWGINVFQIPKNDQGEYIIDKEDHIHFVISVFEQIFDDNQDKVSPQMRQLLRLAIIRTINQEGNFKDFTHFIEYPEKVNMRGAYIESTSASVLNRVEKLMFGNIGRCLCVKETTFAITKLIEENVIIDLSAFEAMEDQKGRQIFLDIVFQYLYYFLRISRLSFKEEGLPKNIFILDEIQKLIPAPHSYTKSSGSMIARGPWTLRAYDVSMIFIGTDPVVDQSMLSNAGVMVFFYTKHDPRAVSTLLGISLENYEHLKSLLKIKPDERRFIISVNGEVTLMKSNEFHLKPELVSDIKLIQKQPAIKALQEQYNLAHIDPLSLDRYKNP